MKFFSIPQHDHVQRSLKQMLTLTVLLTAFLASLGNAQAYTVYQGGDWGGMDFAPANGDVLFGTFTNVGRFIVNAGDIIYAGSSDLTLNTTEIDISGIMYGGSTPSPSLHLNSQGNITLTSTGILDQWASIFCLW